MLAARQKTKRLVARTREANEKVFSVFKAREPQEHDNTRTTQITQEPPAEEQERATLAKLIGWLLRPLQATSAWTRKLRNRLSR